MYQSDKQDQKSDTLTWWLQNLFMNVNDKWIVNQFQILLLLKWFEKIQLVFTNHEFSEEKAEINKWDMNLDDLMNYEYAHNSWIQSILTAVKTGQQ